MTQKFISFRVRIYDLALLGMLFMCATTFLSWLGRFHWIFDNLDCFHVQYAAVLVVCTLVLILYRKWTIVVISCVCIFLNLIPVMSMYIPAESRAEGPQKLRLMLTNVFTGNGKYSLLENYVLEQDPDILLMEEINQAWFSNMRAIRQHYPYTKGVPRSDNFGIVLFSKYPLMNVEVKYFNWSNDPIHEENAPHGLLSSGDREFDYWNGVPTIACDVDINGRVVHFVGTHPLPPIGADYSTKRNYQIEKVAEYCSQISDRPVILLGDLNMPHWSYYLKRLERQSGLRNTAKGFGVHFTWPAYGVMQFMSNPIDHCLVSDDIAVTNRFVGKFVGSDHFPIIVDLKL